MSARGPLAAVLAAAVALGGCGGDSERDRVAAYVREANAVQRDAAPAFERANRTYVRFARGRLPAGRAPGALERSQAAIAGARRRLSALDPPGAARRLHRELLRLFDLNLGLARETTALARYAPARAGAVRPLAGAGRDLARGLGRAGAPRAQADVLGAYARRVSGVARRLRALRPPPVTASAHRALVRRLEATARAARALRASVLGRDSGAVARRLVAFRRLTASAAGSRGITRAAVAAYSRRREAIARAVGEIRRELVRLDRRTS